MHYKPLAGIIFELMHRFFLLTFFLTGCVTLHPSSSLEEPERQPVEMSDRSYLPSVRSVQMYAAKGPFPIPALNPPVVRLGNDQIVLEFDVLNTSLQTLTLRLIHCQYNWKPSSLSDLDFLNDFNAFPITDFDYSIDTATPYIRYRVVLPPVKLPGNYVAIVYRNNDPRDVILTRRFMIFQPQVNFFRETNMIGPGRVAELNQQINFVLNYSRTELINPMETVFVTIRQNQRWDNRVEGLRPNFIREHQRELEYRFFTSESQFPAGNEFRFFDLRSLMNPGNNIDRIDRNTQPPVAWLSTDRSRSGQRYARYPDLNGQYVLSNLDNPQPNSGEYILVRFSLASPPVPGNVYVVGAFTDWRLDDEFKLTYQETTGLYQTDVLLRQGWYNYQYVVKSENLLPNALEGNHYETENLYEIFVYYRSMQPPADLLIGYFMLNENNSDR
jgi:hypothetical protein